MHSLWRIGLLAGLLSGCTALPHLPSLPGKPAARPAPVPSEPVRPTPPAPAPSPAPACPDPTPSPVIPAPVPAPTPVSTPPTPVPVPPPGKSTPTPLPEAAPDKITAINPEALQPAAWGDLPGWREDDLGQAWPAFLESCRVLRRQPTWRAACDAAPGPWAGDGMVRAYLEQHFQPYQVVQEDGTREGLVTGYYEPLLRGSRTPDSRYRYPVYGPPDDLLVVDLAGVYPELRGLRLRGRLQGNRVVPYPTRADIEAGRAPLAGKEIAWVDDPVELFFLQVQGSGRLRLENGQLMRLGYADQNGHPYRSIGRWLVEQGELPLEKASMQGIKDWARSNATRLPELLNTNPSYVFFRELEDTGGGPLGSLAVPLTPERSIAVDPRAIPLGAPVWLDSTRPNSSDPLRRLVLAQDTGSAIKGNVRADFFWGFGDEAGRRAGAMKQKGRLWLLLPRDYPMAVPR